MRIDVTYAGGAPRVIETSGESMLSSSTVANAPEWAGTGLPVSAVMLRPRTDLLCQGDSGLVVEVCAWSSATDGWREGATISDLGNVSEVPRLLLHVFRVWEVLPPEDVARALAIDIDGRIHVRRIGGDLLDLTAYERIEDEVLGRAERDGSPLAERVILVHARMRAVLGVDDDRVGETYGLGRRLFDYAMASGAGGADASTEERDVLAPLVEELSRADDFEGRVDVLMGAILDDGSLTLEALEASAQSLGLGTDDLAEAWSEAEGRLADEAGWDSWDAE